MGTPGRKKTGRKSKRASARRRTKPAGSSSPPKQRTISVKEVNRRTRRMSVDFMSDEVRIGIRPRSSFLYFPCVSLDPNSPLCAHDAASVGRSRMCTENWSSLFKCGGSLDWSECRVLLTGYVSGSIFLSKPSGFFPDPLYPRKTDIRITSIISEMDLVPLYPCGANL